MPFDYEGAKAAGYSDSEIQGFLSGGNNAAPKMPAPPANIPYSNNLGAAQKFQEGYNTDKGKALAQNDVNYPKATQALNQAAYEAAKQIKNAGRVEGQVAGDGSWAVGSFDANTPAFLPSTVDTIANIDQIDANNFINALGALKSASPQGSTGLGAVSEAEGAKIQRGNFNFDRSQSEPQFLKNIGDYKSQIRNSLKNTVDVFNKTYGTNLTPEDLIKQYEPDPEQTKKTLKEKYGLQ